MRQLMGGMQSGTPTLLIQLGKKRWDDGALPPADNDAIDEEFQITLKRKVFRVGKYFGSFGSTSRARLGVLANFVLEPLDWLWKWIQHLGEQPLSILQIVTPETSPFKAVERRLSGFLVGHLAPTPLAAAWNHYGFERTEGDKQDLTFEDVKMVLKVLGQVRWRFSVFFEAWPFPLLRLCDATVSQAEQLRIAESLFSAPPCFVDAYCGQKLRMKYASDSTSTSANMLINDKDLMGVLTSWAEHARVCNMHVERIFALIRKSSPLKNPNVERACASGYLAQLSHSHKKSGGTDINSMTRADLLNSSTPISALKETVAANPSKARAHICYMTHKGLQAS